MGYGVSAVTGDKIALSDCLVIDNDALFNKTIAKLARAAQYNIDVKVLLCNVDICIVSVLQRLCYEKKFVHKRRGKPDFVLASEAFGVKGSRSSDLTDIEIK